MSRTVTLRSAWLVLVSIWLTVWVVGCAQIPPSESASSTATGASDEMSDDADAPQCPTSQSILCGWGAKYDATDFCSIANEFASKAEAYGESSVIDGNAFEAMTVDHDLQELLNQHKVVLVASHGWPNEWQFFDRMIPVDSILLGSCASEKGSPTRYFIVSACSTVAHGPISGTCPGDKEYGCPGQWDPADVDQLNVYARWAPAYGDGLRMICGAATTVDASNAVPIWDDFPPQVSVADTVLLRLTDDAIALCLSQASGDLAKSSLTQDMAFLTEPNPYGDSHYHIAYTHLFSGTHTVADGIPVPAELIAGGNDLAVYFETLATTFPSCLPTGRAPDQQFRRSLEPLAQQNLDFGSITFATEAAVFDALNTPETDYIANAFAYIQAQNWLTRDQPLIRASAHGTHQMLSAIPVAEIEQPNPTLQFTRKNVAVHVPQKLPLPVEDRYDLSPFYEALGIFGPFEDTARVDGAILVHVGSARIDNGLITVVLNNNLAEPNTSVIGAINRWYDFEAWGAPRQVRPLDEIYQRALWSLYAPEAIGGCDARGATDAAPDRSWREQAMQLLDAGNVKPREIHDRVRKCYGEPPDWPYRLTWWNFSYSSFHPDRGRQTPMMGLLFEFRFVPASALQLQKDEVDGMAFPPIDIYVAGQTDASCE